MAKIHGQLVDLCSECLCEMLRTGVDEIHVTDKAANIKGVPQVSGLNRFT